MSGRTCYHCKQWVEQGEAHDCWTTTEAALTADLSEDLREAWERLRDSASALGEQRIYASHSSIMFSRQSCYFFVRPKRSFLELNVFLGRTISAPAVRRIVKASAAKTVHVIQIRHRDEVEAPITEWLEEAYRFAGEKAGAAPSTREAARTKAAASAPRRAASRARPAASPPTPGASRGKPAARSRKRR